MLRDLYRIPACAAALLLMAASGATGVTVSGQVVDELGFGIFNVDLDFFNRDTGQIEFTPFDNTDAGGFYSVDVPVAEYDILFDANNPMFLNHEIRVDITGPTTIDALLYFAQLAQGHVQDEAGLPLVNVDLNFEDLATGDIINTPNDNTDAFGDFSVFVPGIPFDVYFTPPLGMPKAGQVLRNVAVAGTTSLGVITLPDGHAVTGRVLNPVGSPAAGIDTDFTDAATGEVIYTPRDDTDGLGNLSVLVAAGSYDVTVRPPAANGWAWQTIHDVVVGGAVPLGDIALETGFAVTGTVVDESLQSVVLADLDMVSLATGRDLPTPDDNTTVLGAFSLLSPATTFDLMVRPPSGAPLAGAVVRNVNVSGATNLGSITLPAGFPINGTVRDVYGTPVANVDLDAFEVPSGLAFPLIDDDTAPSGAYSVRLPSGSWALVANPPVGSGLLPRSVLLDPLAGPTSLDIVLASSSVAVPESGPLNASGMLFPNRPNPFRGSTQLSFQLPRGARSGELAILDASGRLVRGYRLSDGAATLDWDGRDSAGGRVAAGIYFYRLRAENVEITRKMTLIR
ncbi:MAG: hypothetical protein DHS20C21_22880 [Gemmatimonadota bacterium]|nr:MAG: hypothetical protein DHS20C21_22880 [Gemmatimonadota bacterium]